MTERYDKLDCMLFAAAGGFCSEEVEKFMNLDVSDVPESARYIRKRKRMIAKQRHKPFFSACRRVARTVAVVLVIIFSLGFITVMSVSALRNAVFDVIVDWFENYVQVVFACDDPGENAGLEIEDLKKITGLPEGVEEEIEYEYGKHYTVNYFFDGERICSLRQHIYWKNTTYIDNEGLIIEEITIDGHTAHLFETENGVTRLYWSDGVYSYIIVCFSESLDIVELAKSVE